MDSIYYKCENPPVLYCRPISDPGDNFGPVTASYECSGNFCLNIAEHLNFYLFWLLSGSKMVQKYSPGAYTLHTSNNISNELKVVQLSARNNFYTNPLETLCKISKKVTVDLFGDIRCQKGTQNMAPVGTLHALLKVVPVSLKASFVWIQWKYFTK